MTLGLIGLIDTPNQGNKRVDGAYWIADNGCFSNKWDSKKWWGWVTSLGKTMDFATCPDVVADWDSTRRLFDEWSPRMREEGLPIAAVLQDGAKSDDVEWQSISAVFVGGSTEWKLGAEAASIVADANGRGITTHMGRVNSLRRMRYAKSIGVDGVDGTHMVFHPTMGLADVLRWLDVVESQTALFGCQPAGIGPLDGGEE